MTNAKTTKKTAPAQNKEAALRQEELKIACEIHTLTQLLCSEISMTNPWVAPAHPMAGSQPPMVWPPNVPEAFPPTWPVPARGAW